MPKITIVIGHKISVIKIYTTTLWNMLLFSVMFLVFWISSCSECWIQAYMLKIGMSMTNRKRYRQMYCERLMSRTSKYKLPGQCAKFNSPKWSKICDLDSWALSRQIQQNWTLHLPLGHITLLSTTFMSLRTKYWQPGQRTGLFIIGRSLYSWSLSSLISNGFFISIYKFSSLQLYWYSFSISILVCL